MIALAIAVLWFLIGLIVLAGIIWLAIWVINTFVYPIPDRVQQAIWVIVLLLALIALLTMLATGGGGIPNPFHHAGFLGPILASIPASAVRYL